MSKEKAKAVVVCTEHRGVFFGYVKADSTPEKIVLTAARNCVHWSSDVRGVCGLASGGPTKGCRIGPSVPELELWRITAVLACTPEAISAWEAGPWI